MPLLTRSTASSIFCEHCTWLAMLFRLTHCSVDPPHSTDTRFDLRSSSDFTKCAVVLASIMKAARLAVYDASTTVTTNENITVKTFPAEVLIGLSRSFRENIAQCQSSSVMTSVGSVVFAST